MKRAIALAAASLLASSAFSFAQQDDDLGLSDNGLGANGGVQSETANQGRDNEQLGVDEETTAAIGNEQFDRALTLLRSGGFDIDTVERDADVRIIDLSKVPEERRQTLDNEISANQSSVGELRADLANLGVRDLDQYAIENAVAAEVNARNELVVYVR